MFADEFSYQISKFLRIMSPPYGRPLFNLRKIKVKIVHADRTKVLRTVGVLVVFLAVFSISPERVEEPEEGEVQGVKGESSNNTQQFNNLTIEQFAPQRLPDSPPMATISARAVYVTDSKTGTVLFEKNADERLPMASLTKIMTAVVVLDQYRLDEVVTIPEVCTNLPPNEMGLAPKEKISVEALLYGMLVASGSDAACALSHHFKGDFLKLMNQRAEALGLTQTHFENEVGLDGENGNHLSTAKDLVKLSKEALKNGVFRKIVGTRQVNVANTDQTRWHTLTATNELLFTLPGTTGVKTGLTEQAGGCLAISYERDGHEIIGVILGSEERFLETQNILNWVFKVYSFSKIQS